MADHPLQQDEDAAQIARLRQFITWMFAIVSAFALAFSIAYVLFGRLFAAITALILFGYLGLLMIASERLRRARLWPAMVLTCAGLIVAALLIVVIQPYLYPALAFVPLLAVGVALPFVRERSLRIMLALCWLVMVGVALIGELVPSLDRLPSWFDITVRIGALAAAAALALLLLWQLGHRFNETLERSQSTYRSLSESEERYRLLAEHSSDLIELLDRQGNVLYASPSHLPILGYTSVELALTNIFALIHPEDRDPLHLAMEELLTFKTSQIIELRLGQKAGGWIIVEAALSAIVDATLSEPCLLISARDITARKRSEEAQRRSEATFSALLAATPDLMLRIGGDGAFRDFKPPSDAAERSPPGRFVGTHVGDVFPAEVAQAFMSHIERALRSGELQVWEYEFAQNDQVSEREARIVVCGEDEVLVIVRDITERKRAEAERIALERKLLETQKLESLGVLAGGIAHDFNNLLTAILGNAGMAQLDLPPTSPTRDTLRQIEQAAERAAELTQQMLAYAGKGHVIVRRLDLNVLIEEIHSLIETSLGTSVTLRYHLARGLPAVEADAAQIRQALLNLVINAAEAIGDLDGAIDVRTAVVSIEQADLGELDLAPDRAAADYVLLQVTDTGCGMDAETRARIFDPFFTTKFTGRGLGLPAVLGIVRAHYGGLKVQSEVGRGTTCTMVLPSARGEPGANDRRAHHGGPVEVSAGTVLVVDDEPAVRTVAARLLERNGFVVLQAADGQKAIELFQNYHDTITAVLLDLTMPHLDGGQVFSEIQRVKPGARVVLMSGYTEDEATKRFVGAAPAGFLQKPFTPNDLRSALRRAIEVSDV